MQEKNLLIVTFPSVTAVTDYIGNEVGSVLSKRSFNVKLSSPLVRQLKLVREFREYLWQIKPNANDKMNQKGHQTDHCVRNTSGRVT